MPVAQDDGRLLGLEVDPVDGLGGLVDHVRRPVRPQDDAAQVRLRDRLLEAEEQRGIDGEHPEGPVQANRDLAEQRRQ